MSRGFVKEGDQEELPIIPPRAPLPAGVPNYVTPNGYRLLVEERAALQDERIALSKENEREYRHAVTFIDGKLNLLNHRIATAQQVDLSQQPQNEVRFGAQVELKSDHHPMSFQIVGVDEADIKVRKIAFTAPIARVITGKKVGESVSFQRGKTVQMLTVLKISYPIS